MGIGNWGMGNGNWGLDNGDWKSENSDWEQGIYLVYWKVGIGVQENVAIKICNITNFPTDKQ